MAYEFANCLIDPDKHLFVCDGLPVHVEPQVFDLLLVLVDRKGRLVTKDDLVETVWQGLSVSDATISARINAARKAVGDTGREQAIIKTVHGRGFQLNVEVKTATALAQTPDLARSDTQTLNSPDPLTAQKLRSPRAGMARHWSGSPIGYRTWNSIGKAPSGGH